jgi:Gpi18-like mannosyltransferase
MKAEYKKYAIVLGIFSVWLSLLLVVGHFSQQFSTWPELQVCANRSDPPYYRWDAGWYTEISQKGYSFSPDRQSSVAFWPLYPMAIHAAHRITSLSPGRAAYDLSIVFAFLATIAIYGLVRLDWPEKTSRYIIALILFWPASYFLIAVYPESLFILLAALSLYMGRKKKWLWAGIFSALLALTKPYGVFMVPTLLAEYFLVSGKDWRIFFKKWDWSPLLLPLVSVFSFMYFNFAKFGNAVAFLQTEKNWGRGYGNFALTLVWEAREFLVPPSKLLDGSHSQYAIYLVSFFFSLWAFYISWKKVRRTYLIFPFLILLSAITSGTLTSWSRYMLLGFPILLGPAVWLSEKKYLRYPYLAISLFFLLFIAHLFVRCYPVE